MSEQDARFPSQKLPQIPMIRLGVDEAWIVGGIERYRSSFEAEHGVSVELAQVVRKAIVDVLSDGSPKFAAGKSAGTEAWIGPFRLTEKYQALPKMLTAAAKRAEVTEADVIRGALAQWLTAQGFGEKKRKGK